MDQNVIFDCVTDVMKWLAISGGSYIFALYMLGRTHGFSQRLSPTELERAVEEEAQILGLDPSKIKVDYGGEPTGSLKHEEGYILHVGPTGMFRPVVRHELYHVLKDCDRRNPKNLFYYLFIAEPRAILYGSFKIKF